MITKEDIEYLIQISKREILPYPPTGKTTPAIEALLTIAEMAPRLEALKKLWTKEGLPVKEVDIHLLGEVPGRKQLTQIHSFAVGDTYKLEEPVSTYYNYNLGEAGEVDDWKIQDIRTHMVKGE